MPEVPVDRIKAIWKAEKLNRSVQLTISGCLGPCDLPNVAVDSSRPKGLRWYGLLNGDADYDAIIDWARASLAGGEIMPLPEAIEGRSLQRFAAPEVATVPSEAGGSSS